MNPAPPAPEPTPSPALLAAGLAQILRNLCILIAARFRLRKIAPHTCALCSYLNRLAQRFTRLMDRLAQGPLPPNRSLPPSRSHTPRPSGAPHPSVKRPRHRLPTGPLWLIRAIPNEAACHASQIAHLLAQPGMADIIATTPRAARLLRLLFRLLGLELPAPEPPAANPPALPPTPEPKPRQPCAPRPHLQAGPAHWPAHPVLRPLRKNPA